jgi:hypothetical protein
MLDINAVVDEEISKLEDGAVVFRFAEGNLSTTFLISVITCQLDYRG